MNKFEFLLNGLKNKNYKKRNWLISLIAVTHETNDTNKQELFPYKLLRTPIGIECLVDVQKNERVVIEDIDPAGIALTPLFSFQDEIIINNDVYPGVAEGTVTNLGTLLFNLIVLYESFGTKIPYINPEPGKWLTGESIETQIAELLDDTPEDSSERKPDRIYIDELIKFIDSLTFIRQLGILTTQSSTRKNTSLAKGMVEFRNNLIATKYAGKLNDPVEVYNLEKDCQKYDDEFLKDDPTTGLFMSGKIRNISRKKLNVFVGIETVFPGQNPDPILTSLGEGWVLDEKSFTTMVNASRAASDARGSETVKGGMAAKILSRSLPVEIVNGDCGSEIYLERKYLKTDYKKLVGIFIKTQEGIKLIKSVKEAEQFIDKIVFIRSPAYCKLSTAYKVCSVCSGAPLSLDPKGVTSAFSSISDVVITSSLKSMHGKETVVNKIDFNTHLT